MNRHFVQTYSSTSRIIAKNIDLSLYTRIVSPSTTHDVRIRSISLLFLSKFLDNRKIFVYQLDLSRLNVQSSKFQYRKMEIIFEVW